MADAGVLIAAAARPHPTEDVSGDAWHVDWNSLGCRIALIDGLGHGPAAAEAAARAREVLAASPDAHPADVLRLCHEALRRTRGAAMGVAAILPDDGRVIYAGIGNVEARLVVAGRTVRLLSSRGIVGAVLPTVRPVEAKLEPGWLFLIHTDGISDRFTLDEGVAENGGHPQLLADTILSHWARAADDATIVVACREQSVR